MRRVGRPGQAQQGLLRALQLLAGEPDGAVAVAQQRVVEDQSPGRHPDVRPSAEIGRASHQTRPRPEAVEPEQVAADQRQENAGDHQRSAQGRRQVQPRCQQEHRKDGDAGEKRRQRGNRLAHHQGDQRQQDNQCEHRTGGGRAERLGLAEAQQDAGAGGKAEGVLLVLQPVPDQFAFVERTAEFGDDGGNHSTARGQDHQAYED